MEQNNPENYVAFDAGSVYSWPFKVNLVDL